MINMIHFGIPLNPVTKKNHSEIKHLRGKGGGTYHVLVPSKAYQKYEQDAGWFLNTIAAKIKEPIDRKVNVKAVYYMREDYLTTKRVIDLNGLNQALHDVLVKYNILKDDKCQIVYSVDGSRVDYDATYPRTEVVITDLELEYLNFI